MANQKISALTAATTSLLATFPAVQGGVNVGVPSELLVSQALDELPELFASEFGAASSASSSANSTAIEAAVDELPTEGGVIRLPPGILNWGGLSGLKGRRTILIKGCGGQGAGAATGTILRANTASGSRIIDARDTVNVSFEDVYIQQQNTSFAGHLIDYGAETIGSTTGSSLMRVKNCTLLNSGTTGSSDLQLYGATQGVFESITFGGARHVKLQDVNGVGLANSLLFSRCDFVPSGTDYPVSGSGEGVTFFVCNVQRCSGDLKQRFIQTSANQDFRNINVLGCTAYDAGAGGFVTMDFKQGEGLNVAGGMIGGYNAATTYAIQLGGSGTGVRGFAITGVSFRGGAASINLPGVVGSGTHAYDGVIGGNSVYGGTLLAGTGINNVVLLPNYIDGAANDLGAHFNVIGLPTSAAGLQTGDWYNSSGTVKVA